MTLRLRTVRPKKSKIRAISAMWAGAMTLMVWPFAAQAADPRPPQQSKRAGPPAQAMQACASLNVGQACSFDDQSRKVNGSCWAPEGKPLACRPSHPARQGRTPGPGTAH